MLVLSFIDQTRVQFVDDEEGLGELESQHSFITDKCTLCCTNVIGDLIAQVSEFLIIKQVTHSEIILISCASLNMVSCWRPETSGIRITQASVNASQITISLSGRKMTHFEIFEKRIIKKRFLTFY